MPGITTMDLGKCQQAFTIIDFALLLASQYAGPECSSKPAPLFTPILLPVSLDHRITGFTEEFKAMLVGASFFPLCYLKYLDYCAAVLPSFRSNVSSAAQVLFLFHKSSFLCYLSFCFSL